MRIPPIAELGVSGNVLAPDVKSAHVADLVVNNHDFPVVAVIHSKLKPSQDGRKENPYLHTALLQFLPFLLRHETAAHTVTENTDLHSGSGPFGQNRADGIEQLIVLDDIVLKVDKTVGFSQFLAQIRIFCLAIRKNTDSIVDGQNRS